MTQRIGVLALSALYLAVLSGDAAIAGIPVRAPLLAGAGLTLAAWISVSKPAEVNRRPQFLYPLVLYFGWMVTTVLWAPTGARTWATTREIAVLVATLLLASSILRRLDGTALDVVFHWLVWTAAIFLVAAILSGPGSQGRFAAFSGGPNVFVRIMVLGSIGALYLGTTRSRKWHAAASLFVIGGLLSGSRGGVIAFALAILVLLLFTRTTSAATLWRSVFLAAVGTVAFAALAPSLMRKTVVQRFLGTTFQEWTDSDRKGIFRASIELFGANPTFGAGLDGFSVLRGSHEGWAHPHNLVTASLAEGGIIAACLLAAGLWAVFNDICRSKRSTTLSDHLLLAGLYVLAASMFSGYYYDSRFAWIFFLMSYAALAPDEPDQSRRSSAKRTLPRLQ